MTIKEKNLIVDNSSEKNKLELDTETKSENHNEIELQNFKTGDIYLCYFTYSNSENSPGKKRPIAIQYDPIKNELKGYKISTKIDKPIVNRVGYIIQDWQEAGLKKPCYISCENENIRDIMPNKLTKFIGKLSERDIRGMLNKRNKLIIAERAREKSKEYSR